jgi:ParB family chromosome partitioning protein
MIARMKKKRLGRGLDALLSNSTGELPGDTAGDMLRSIPVDLLSRGQYQPRTRMDEESLRELAASIKAQGIIQPILVRETNAGNYEIIAGERRWRAAQLAELSEVPVVVRDIPDEATLAVALIENIQRENLNPIEEAAGLRRLLDEFGLTHQQAADGVGRSRTAVTNLLRLLSLSKGARELLEEGKLEMGHARALLALPENQQDPVAREVYARQLSVRQTEAMVRRHLQGRGSGKKPGRKDPDVKKLEDTLSERLGARVDVQDRGGKGKVVIEYHSLDELDGIIDHIK